MPNNDNNILIKIKPDKIVTFGELKNFTENNTREPEYYGKFLGKDIKENLIFGLCVKKESTLSYQVQGEADISYIDGKMKYNFKIKITDIRQALPKDGFDIKRDMLNELKGNLDVDKYIIEARAITKPEPSSRREFFRMPLQMAIYCREIATENINELTETDLKFEIERARLNKREADAGILEEEEGYFKLITADISAGGFMFKSPEPFEAETYLDCMMIVDREALPVVAKILRSRDDEILDGYIVHVQFYKISDPVRDRLVKYLISMQRQQRMIRR